MMYKGDECLIDRWERLDNDSRLLVNLLTENSIAFDPSESEEYIYVIENFELARRMLVIQCDVVQSTNCLLEVFERSPRIACSLFPLLIHWHQVISTIFREQPHNQPLILDFYGNLIFQNPSIAMFLLQTTIFEEIEKALVNTSDDFSNNIRIIRILAICLQSEEQVLPIVSRYTNNIVFLLQIMLAQHPFWADEEPCILLIIHIIDYFGQLLFTSNSSNDINATLLINHVLKFLNEHGSECVIRYVLYSLCNGAQFYQEQFVACLLNHDEKILVLAKLFVSSDDHVFLSQIIRIFVSSIGSNKGSKVTNRIMKKYFKEIHGKIIMLLQSDSDFYVDASHLYYRILEKLDIIDGNVFNSVLELLSFYDTELNYEQKMNCYQLFSMLVIKADTSYYIELLQNSYFLVNFVEMLNETLHYDFLLLLMKAIHCLSQYIVDYNTEDKTLLSQLSESGVIHNLALKTNKIRALRMLAKKIENCCILE